MQGFKQAYIKIKVFWSQFKHEAKK